MQRTGTWGFVSKHAVINRGRGLPIHENQLPETYAERKASIPGNSKNAEKITTQGKLTREGSLREHNDVTSLGVTALRAKRF